MSPSGMGAKRLECGLEGECAVLCCSKDNGETANGSASSFSLSSGALGESALPSIELLRCCGAQRLQSLSSGMLRVSCVIGILQGQRRSPPPHSSLGTDGRADRNRSGDVGGSSGGGAEDESVPLFLACMRPVSLCAGCVRCAGVCWLVCDLLVGCRSTIGERRAACARTGATSRGEERRESGSTAQQGNARTTRQTLTRTDTHRAAETTTPRRRPIRWLTDRSHTEDASKPRPPAEARHTQREREEQRRNTRRDVAASTSSHTASSPRLLSSAGRQQHAALPTAPHSLLRLRPSEHTPNQHEREPHGQLRSRTPSGAQLRPLLRSCTAYLLRRLARVSRC